MSWIEIEIEDVVQETPVDRRFRLSIPSESQDDFQFVAGQFVTVRDPEHAESGQRAYSICSAPDGGALLDVTVRDMGNFGHEFYDYKAGKRLLAKAPMGRFTLAYEPGDHVVMVAGGSGVTPFRSYLGQLELRPPVVPAWLLHSSRRGDQLIFRESFEAASAKNDWFNYLPTVTREEAGDTWGGRRGRIDEALLRRAITDPSMTHFHVCGPGVFVKEMLGLAAAIGVPDDRRRKEQWG